jgi:hypothetical protein
VNAAFFALACLAALNPKMLVIDLTLATNQRPRQMFVCFLLSGMGLGIAVGLLDVLVLHLDAITTQNHAAGGLDLALGIPLLILGALLATDHLHIHRRRPRPTPEQRLQSRLQGRAVQALHKPRYGFAVLVGLVVGIPGATYLVALHHLVTSKPPAAIAVIAVIVFVTINFALVIVPFGYVVFRPEGAEDAIKRFRDWIVSHERRIAAAVLLLAGAYMVISGTLRVLS